MKKIKTFKDACKALKIKPVLPDVSALPEKHQKAIIAHYKLVIITQALNNGWVPDWNDGNQWKYYTWFKIDADEKNTAGFGFSHACYDYASTYAYVGSRLCFSSSELALYAGKQFIDLYKEYFLFLK